MAREYTIVTEITTDKHGIKRVHAHTQNSGSCRIAVTLPYDTELSPEENLGRCAKALRSRWDQRVKASLTRI